MRILCKGDLHRPVHVLHKTLWDASVWLQLLAVSLTKWNLPVPCKLGRETRCVLQNWNEIFPTPELSFTRGFMNELMTHWWRIIINNILPLPECSLDYYFKLTLNHQGPYNSKMNRLIMNACITRETFVFKVFRRVFNSSLKRELCRHACRRRDPIISTCRYGKYMPTTALMTTQLSIPFPSSLLTRYSPWQIGVKITMVRYHQVNSSTTNTHCMLGLLYRRAIFAVT